ncbi:hypothetical protein GRX03_15755 [Halovenus sp. WSH3]|uniref:DUF7123 domain-containing protein n=1 Tax=Halovenus carboxidivorans TaxID=2692199 RepID=A0A6B0TBN8_9EURY|nr:hypothetical protein [Halovenus carboxidivorans]MXR53053.1 hypothetical protein [Halovenus carboxidivorans]
MCAQRSPNDDSERDRSDAHSDLPPKARRLLAYLDAELDGESYLKSRDIAGDLELSAKEIGAMMARLQDEPVGPTIEKWGYTNGTTWRVTTD